MNINDLTENMGISHFGQWLTTEEILILQNSLVILQNENHFKNAFFWGKIYGSEEDYYIAYGYENDALMGNIFYYSKDCLNWGRLPKPTTNGLQLTPLCTTKFQGDPYLVIDVLIEKDDPTITFKRNQAETGLLKEEDRLATTVYNITKEAFVVPRGAIHRLPSGIVIENEGFNGLSLLDAREIKSFIHFRPPLNKYNENLLTRPDYNYAIDFMDTLQSDIPLGCWHHHITTSNDLVTLKSLTWPGLKFFHKIRTPKYGCSYFGHGNKSLDTVFSCKAISL